MYCITRNALCLSLPCLLLNTSYVLGRKIFGVFFNVESALAVHQLPTRWQIFNSRGGSFGLKLALACIMLANYFVVHKCVFIQNGGQLATKKVLFAANCTAFSGKTQGKMRQNAVRVCQNRHTLSFFAQSPDFLKPGLCYVPKFL